VAYRVAYRLLGDRGDAEDVTQEALVRAYTRWRTVGPYDEPWVARVASNLAIDRWRRRQPLREAQDVALDGLHDEHVLRRLGLVAALARLPQRQREVVVLRYLADLPERDVASAMRTSIGSVKQHTHRALGRLRIELGPHPQEANDVP
jgi:RNA polymerase sigma factor (sigma-70 family)